MEWFATATMVEVLRITGSNLSSRPIGDLAQGLYGSGWKGSRLSPPRQSLRELAREDRDTRPRPTATGKLGSAPNPRGHSQWSATKTRVHPSRGVGSCISYLHQLVWPIMDQGIDPSLERPSGVPWSLESRTRYPSAAEEAPPAYPCATRQLRRQCRRWHCPRGQTVT